MDKETLKKCLPDARQSNIDKFVDPLSKAMEKFEINTPIRQAAFLAQIAHESSSLSRVEENLNYSVTGLITTFPRYFRTAVEAEPYARKPEKIANRVYANRMGNGNEASGDGWKYRGKGPIQITGKDNHKAVGDALDYDFVSRPEDIMLPGAGAMSAAWFWKINGLNELADQGNFEKITKRINGGLNGLEDRRQHWERIKKILND